MFMFNDCQSWVRILPCHIWSSPHSMERILAATAGGAVRPAHTWAAVTSQCSRGFSGGIRQASDRSLTASKPGGSGRSDQPVGDGAGSSAGNRQPVAVLPLLSLRPQRADQFHGRTDIGHYT